MGSTLRLRAYFTEQEWNETPNERKARLADERFAEQMKSEKTLSLLGPPDDRARLSAVLDPILNKVAPRKGACPKCGKHIGKGIHFHVKACKGE